jgi:hypothetical protein
MKPQQTAENYDKLASHWNSDEFNRNNGIAQHKRAIRFVPNSGMQSTLAAAAADESLI